MKYSGSLLFAALALTACGATIQRDGYTLDQADTRDAVTAVTNRAAFELRCPREQIQTQVLNTSRYQSTWAGQIGVSGCGHRAVYVRADASQTWLMNTQNEGTASASR